MNDQNEESGIYYYHADHLGSSSVVTDKNGKFHEHLEFFPYGETWINDRANNENLPYRFTGKELDPETGLYFYGARYYDCKLSRWISADPPLASGEYLPNGNKKHDANLPGMGGVFNSINLDAYQYCGQNPVKFVDPDGRHTEFYQYFSFLLYRSGNKIFLQGRVIVDPQKLTPRRSNNGTIITKPVNMGFSNNSGKDHYVGVSFIGRDEKGQLFRYDIISTSSGYEDSENPDRLITYTQTPINDDGTFGKTSDPITAIYRVGTNKKHGSKYNELYNWFNPKVITGYKEQGPKSGGVRTSKHPLFIQNWKWEETPDHLGLVNQKISDLKNEVSAKFMMIRK